MSRDHWLIPTPELGPEQGGGIGTWADLCARALAGRGDEVTVVAPARGAGSDSDRPYRVLRVPGRSWKRWGPTWLGARSLPTLLQRATAVLAATWPVGSWLQPLCDRRSIPLLVAAHGSDLTALPSPPAGLRRLGPRVGWLPVSDFLGAELGRLGVHGPMQRLPVPLVPPPVPTGPTPDGLVWAGRDTPHKGLGRAVALARALDMPIELVGASAERHGAPGVHATGWLPRPAAVDRLRRRRALVLLPRGDRDGLHQEGLGIVILEAALRGTPSIGCATGGVPEAVGPGLLLADPEAPDLDRVRSFLQDAHAGDRARAHVLAHHGPARFLAALDQARGNAP